MYTKRGTGEATDVYTLLAGVTLDFFLIDHSTMTVIELLTLLQLIFRDHFLKSPICCLKKKERTQFFKHN